MDCPRSTTLVGTAAVIIIGVATIVAVFISLMEHKAGVSNPPPTKQNPVPFVAGGPLVRERSSFIRLCDKRIQPLCKVSRPFRANPRVQPQSR